MSIMLTKWYKDTASKMTIEDILDMIKIQSLPAKLKELVHSVIIALNSKCNDKCKILLLAALLYVAVTFDICPDFIPYFGFLDDISVLSAIIKQIKQE